MRRVLSGGMLIVILLMLPACEEIPAIQPSGKQITIGIIGPMTGEDRAKGEDGLRGIKAARHLMPYLDNGDALELVVEDDHNDSQETTRLIRWMAEEKQVAAILLLSSSAQALKAGAIADAYKLPVLTLPATHTDVVKDREYISQLAFDNYFQGRVAAMFLRDDLLLDRVAIVSNVTSFNSTQLAEEFIRKFTASGGQVTDSFILDQIADDYVAAMRQAQAKGAEALYLPVGAGNVLDLVEAARESGWDPVILGSDGLLATVLTQYADQGKMLEGIYATDFFSHYMPRTDFGERVGKVYGQLFDVASNTYTGLGSEGYMVLASAMNRCEDKTDRDCINRMVRDSRNLEGVIGYISISEDGRGMRPIVVNAIRNGQMEYIVKVY